LPAPDNEKLIKQVLGKDGSSVTSSLVNDCKSPIEPASIESKFEQLPTEAEYEIVSAPPLRTPSTRISTPAA
ncbi:MAG: hypothetical protein L3J46_10350, partial [Kangiellaceae bacterium]|nr:hypothetical protein [Kangiellaceae bacterium]